MSSASSPGADRTSTDDAHFVDATAGIYAVAAGTGSSPHAAAAASQAIEAAVAAARRELADLPRPIPAASMVDAARRAVERACETVFELARPGGPLAGAASTLTLLLVEKTQAAMAHVGDTRAYLVRGRELEQLSADHTVAHELYRAGQISWDQARRHPFRSVLSRSLGPQRSVVVDTLSLHVSPGDTVVLSTGGLSEIFDRPRTAVELLAEGDLDHATAALLARTRELGSTADATVIALRIADTHRDPHAITVDTLQSTSVFGMLDLAARSRVVGAGVLDKHEAGDELLHAGQPYGGLWLVVEGHLQWKSDTIAELGPGDWFGEAALVGEARCPANVRALAPTTMFVLPTERWTRLTRRRPILAASVFRRLASAALQRAPSGDPHRVGRGR
mgnify:CR=1 FL=1